MKTLEFRIVPLSTEIADAARRAADAGASDDTVITADSPTGYPCATACAGLNPASV